MCGITGIFNLNEQPVSYSQLEKMMDILAHRGPDDRGVFIDNNLGLGHRRLSIIDLSESGHQPMCNEDKTIWLTYNGEIYNYLEIKKELKKKGHIFKSKTDTEVIIHAYEQWGEKCLNKFNGMFAFAIWDKSNRTLILARDRYGIKPLYYWTDNNILLFSSEIKSFLIHSSFKAIANREAIFEYFTFQNTFTDKTLFHGVKILQPGSFFKIKCGENKEIKVKKYWDFNFNEDCKKKTEKEYIEELDYVLNKAIKSQLVSDVEVGSYLSGGIDSGLITAISSKSFNDFKTFCIGFDLNSASGMELFFDERKKAEYISYLYQTEHYEMVLKAGDMERCLPDLIWHLEDLRLGQSYPNYYASKLASKFVKVCLSGAGGDELFGGYSWRYYNALNSGNNYMENYYKFWQRLVPNETLKKMICPMQNSFNNTNTKKIFNDVFKDLKNDLWEKENYINNMLYFEAKTFLHGLLIIEDKLGMAHGIESRFPFLDNDLVDLAMKIPIKFKLKNISSNFKINKNKVYQGKNCKRTKDGKIILRKVFNKYVPSKTINLEKQGFSGPDESWFRGESIDYIRELLLNKNANIYNYFNYKVIEKTLNEHISGRRNNRLLIWSLICFELWNDIFINYNKSVFNKNK